MVLLDDTLPIKESATSVMFRLMVSGHPYYNQIWNNKNNKNDFILHNDLDNLI